MWVMAAPPPRILLNAEDIEGAPSWLEKLLGPLNSFIRPVGDGLDRALTFRENFAGEVRSITVTAPEDWVTPVVRTGWDGDFSATNAPFQWRKGLDGRVLVRGRVDYPTGTPTTSSVLAPLPDSSWAPSKREVFDCFASPSLAVLSASSSGFIWESGGSRFLSFSGDVAWEAGDRTPPRWDTPIDVRLGTPQRPFPGRPGHVSVLRARQSNNLEAPAVVTHIDWVPTVLDRAKAVRIHRVWGLLPGVPYTLTLLILPE